jgi:cytochrome c biogenesis protein CcdA
MILMALQTWEVLTIIKPTYLAGKNTKKGYIGALIAGVLGGIFSSPCATPVLVALLTVVARSGNVLFGIFLLLLYSLGNSILVIIAGTSIGITKKISQNKKYGILSNVIKYIMGSIILLIGFYMFYLGF